MNESTSRVAFFSIVSNNYLHYAKTLFESALAQMPNLELFLVIVDSSTDLAVSFLPKVQVLSLEDLDLPDLQRFIFRYSVLELNTAVKPWAFEVLFKRGFDSVIYCDPDILVFQPFTAVFSGLESGHVVLTPHLLAPLSDAKSPSELDIRRVGTYNLGFVAIRNSDVGLALVNWWQEKLELNCVVDLEAGVFVDQSWMDLVPGLFDGVVVLRHVGYNVAYWNIVQRKLGFSAGQWQMRDFTPLVFFHFSGFNAFSFEGFSKHQNRVQLSDVPHLRPLLKNYSLALQNNGAKKWADVPYGFNCFADGKKIPDFFRVLYRSDAFLQKRGGSSPFAVSDLLFALVKDFKQDGISITYAMWSLWQVRPDLQLAFTLESAISIQRFYTWFIAEGGTYFDVPTIDWHKKYAAQFAPMSENSTKTTYADLRRTRVSMLYNTILGREADVNGSRVYSRILKTPLGFYRTVAALWFSRESRVLPNFWQRGWKSLGILAKRGESKKYDFTEIQAPVLAAVVTTPVLSRVASGFYWDNSPDNVNGVWVGATLTIPVVVGKVIRVAGIYHQPIPGSVQRILVWLGSTLQHELFFDASREFTVEFPMVASDILVLRFEASQTFVPTKLGLAADDRILSWRLQRLAVDDVQIFDSRRTPALLPFHQYAQPSGINLVGYVAAELGVGEAARLFAKACVADGVPYSVMDVGYQSPNLQRDKSIFEAAVSQTLAVDLLYVNADQTARTQVFLTEQRQSEVQVLRPRVAFWHWEQPSLPLKFLDAFDGLSEVWVASDFVLQAVSSISPVPVFKMPHAIDFSVSSKATRAHFGLPEHQFLVLVMYDFHSLQFRKNPQAALEVVQRCAVQHPNLTLVVKTINAEAHLEAYKQLRDEFANLSVVWLDQYLTRQEVFDLEFCCDTMLSLHRAEGYGLGLAEMMFLGKPVIATGWSGNMEFMNPMNSMPVQYTLKPLEQDLGPYEAGQVWAEANLEHAEWCLNELLTNSELYTKIASAAQKHMVECYSPKVIGEQIKKRLLLLEARF
jgi:hypothetical protein